MRKTKLFLIFSIFIFFLIEFSYAQEPNLKKILLDIEKGEIDKARILLVSLEKGNPNSPQVNFLKAILSDDGLEAAKLYREVAFSAEENDLKDVALFKLFQFHYSRGEFSESDKYARMLRESFPQSEYVTYLKRENPSTKIQVQQNFEQKILTDTSRSASQEENVTFQKTSKYSIQVGAFSSEGNARKFALQFSGYSTKIREKEVNGKKFFVVLVGDFESEIPAKNELQVLKDKFKVDGIIVPSY